MTGTSTADHSSSTGPKRSTRSAPFRTLSTALWYPSIKALRRRRSGGRDSGPDLRAVFLRDRDLNRRELNLVVHVFLLRLHPLDSLANSRDLPLDIRQLPAACPCGLSADPQALLRVARVGQACLQIDVLACDVRTVLRFLPDLSKLS